jgi:hypothetical protein
MSALEEVSKLKQQAIAILVNERARIDAEIELFGNEKATFGKKRGRPSKVTASSQPSQICSSESAP